MSGGYLGSGPAKKLVSSAEVAIPGDSLWLRYNAAQTLTVAQQIQAQQNAGVSKQGADIASASTVNLDNATGDIVDITGTTTITAITLAQGVQKTVRFTGALTLTNGASLVLPNGASITTSAGSFAIFRGYAAGVVRCVMYSPGVDPRDAPRVQQLGNGITTINWANTDTAIYNATNASSATISTHSNVIVGKLYVLHNTGGVDSLRTVTLDRTNAYFHSGTNVSIGPKGTQLLVGISSTQVAGAAPLSNNS